MTPASPPFPAFLQVARAAAGREWLSHRLNRFLHAHLLLVLIAGLLPLLTPEDALARGAAWWLLNAMLYALSLSVFLLGLSSAQAESDEFPWLLSQPAGIGPWLAGKAAMLSLIAAASAGVLALPTTLAGGGSPELFLTVAGAAGVSVVCALAGLALGFWIRDSVRGLIAALAAWMALLFGADLLLLALAGAPFIQNNPDLWVLPLMLNPLDAFRVTVLFAVERAAFSGLQDGGLAGWWVKHAAEWFAVLAAGWTALTLAAAWLGARRRLDN